MCGRPWSADAQGLLVDVRLTPKGGRDAIGGAETLADGRCVLLARVRVPPAEGAANAALRRLMAEALGVGVGRVNLVAGEKGRIKRLRIDGDGSALAAAMQRVIEKAI
jgi:uncharacterized protein (TIGR00251 family)